MNSLSVQSKRRFVILLTVLSLLTFAVCPFVGQTEIPLSVLSGAGSDVELDIFWKLRLPRVCLSFLAGGALAVSGMVFQAVFRNVLADPFTLGVASGSAFGASIGMRFAAVFGLTWLGSGAMFSFAGAAATMFLVMALASPSRGFPPASMLLAGVITGFFFSSLILLMQYVSDFAQVFRMTRWLMGSMDVVGFEPLIGIVPLVGTGLVIVFILGRQLDLLTLGDDLAVSRGLNVGRARMMLFTATSLMVAGVVAVCGPIGFVGLVVPYVCRSYVGANHRLLHICAMLLGGAFLSLCDTFARIVTAPSEIPVGVVTAIIGGPAFLVILRRSGVGLRL